MFTQHKTYGTLRFVVCMIFAFITATYTHAYTVVIDAGHGGKDTGCVGASVKEKDINLAVAQRVAKILATQKETKVVMTRSTDIFVPLQQRCDIANAAKGDIFVSIHTNSLPETAAGRDKKQGASVYTMGLSRASTNLEVAKRENSVIKLENDYTTKYDGFDPNSTESYIIFELAQNSHIDQSLNLADIICKEMASKAGRINLGVKQEPFWVLVRTSMPSVLIELDFICNPEVEAFLGSEQGRDQLAEAIASGIIRYRSGVNTSAKKTTKNSSSNKTDKQVSEKVTPPKQTSAATSSSNKQSAKEENRNVKTGITTFRIQFLTSAKQLSENDTRIVGVGENINHYTDNGIVKYTVGDYRTMREAQQALAGVKERYPDAFIIMWKDGQRTK